MKNVFVPLKYRSLNRAATLILQSNSFLKILTVSKTNAELVSLGSGIIILFWAIDKLIHNLFLLNSRLTQSFWWGLIPSFDDKSAQVKQILRPHRSCYSWGTKGQAHGLGHEAACWELLLWCLRLENLRIYVYVCKVTKMYLWRWT